MFVNCAERVDRRDDRQTNTGQRHNKYERNYLIDLNLLKFNIGPKYLERLSKHPC